MEQRPLEEAWLAQPSRFPKESSGLSLLRMSGEMERGLTDTRAPPSLQGQNATRVVQEPRQRVGPLTATAPGKAARQSRDLHGLVSGRCQLPLGGFIPRSGQAAEGQAVDCQAPCGPQAAGPGLASRPQRGRARSAPPSVTEPKLALPFPVSTQGLTNGAKTSDAR